MELLLTSFLNIDNFCSIKLKLLWPSELPWILDKLSPTKKQRQSILAHIYKNYFLTSFSLAVVTFVVPNLSHSDYLNLPVTVGNKLLATKKKGQSYFCIFSKQMQLHTYLSFPRVVVGSLALILWHSDYQWLLTTNKWNSISPLKLQLGLEMGRQCHNNQSNQLLFLEKQAFSQQFSHTSALKYKVRLA